jgi:hypothetical protein
MREPARPEEGMGGGDVADIVGLIGFGTFLVVSLFVGMRLLLLARRTRRFPELAVGLDILLAGFVGYGLLLASESLHLLPPRWAGWGSFAGVTAISLGSLFLALFSRRVFRPDDRAAHLALLALTVWLLLGVYGSWVLHVAGHRDGVGGWLGTWAPNVGLLAAYTWASVEPFRYHANLRRRARLGIETVHAIVANRMLLWGAGTAAIASIALVHLVAQLADRHVLPNSLVGLVSSLALVAAIAEWLAFAPPSAYRRRFDRIAQAG